MAQYYLIKSLVIGITHHMAGELVDSANENVSEYVLAGALLWPAGDASIAAAALKAQNAHKLRGASEAECDSIMEAAVDALQLQATGSSAWTAVANWFVDPVNGNDANDGLTAATAIKTNAQLSQRLGKGNFLQGETSSLVLAGLTRTVVNFLGNMPASDPLDLDVKIKPKSLLAFVGKATTVASGTFTAVTAQNRATNTPWSVTDATITWASFIGRRLRITSGPNTGQIGWIAKDLGAGEARISTPNNPNMPASSDALSDSAPPDRLTTPAVTPGIFSVGDTFVIETLSDLYVSTIYVGSSFDGAGGLDPVVGFANLNFRSAFGAIRFPEGIHTPVYKGCQFTNQFFQQISAIASFMINCGFNNGGELVKLMIFTGGLLSGTFNFVIGITGSSFAIFDFDFMCQGQRPQVRGGMLVVGTACVFDAGTSGVQLGTSTSTLPHSTFVQLFVKTGGSGTHALWGANNATVGVTLRPGAIARYVTNVPTIAGTVSDFTLSGGTVGSSFDPATGLTSATTIATTWANLAATLGAGGFGGFALLPNNMCGFLKG